MTKRPNWGNVETKITMEQLNRLYGRVSTWKASELDDNTLQCIHRAMDFVDLYREKLKNEQKQ